MPSCDTRASCKQMEDEVYEKKIKLLITRLGEESKVEWMEPGK